MPKLFKKELHTYEYRFQCKDGTYIWVRDEMKLVRNKDGRPLEIVGYWVNINEYRKSEETLRESEERFRSLAENAPDIIFTLNKEGAWTYVNPAFEEILGYSRDEVIGKYAIGIINEEHARNHIHLFKRIRDEKETIKNESIHLTHKDRSERLFNTSASCNADLQGNMTGVVGLLKDITEHRRLEAQFRQSQKMEAIGTLAGGIAHDFNNILMGIQGRTSLMLIDTDSSHPHFEHLRGIEDYVKSAADLTKQLLGFARSGKYEVKSTDLNEVIKGQNRMFGRTKKEIAIRGKYEEILWTVEVDQGQIGQVLLNLYVNAWQAMPNGGSLYVQTENVMLDENAVKPFDLEPGRYVRISVTDTGIGMDKETQQRIFDPFFTTKEMGRGTGLGLATVYGIIKNHGGIINVHSEKGVGSTFSIYLPASEKEPTEEMQVQEDFLKGKETILLVDDEEMIIDVSEQLLKKMGYRVFLARGGREAVKVYKTNKDKIDLIILDMIMPDMGGAEAYDRMKEINPDMRVLLSSGYAENGLAMEILERGCDGFIQKPFNMKQLSQKIREILESEHL
ncbi:MAG: PAS domain S-box protein [Thermodesulfobacteriota bacterium]|nr:PAS domain S-box protein [Thermodesulfobacteriota bacterium]